MKKIKLTGGKYALVDDEDYPYLNRFKWGISAKGYAYREVKRNKNSDWLAMHQLVIQGISGCVIIHRNQDTLDNRKCNLFNCGKNTLQHSNRKRVGLTSTYKGVHWDKQHNKWRASISYDKKKFNMGRYLSEKEAALVYNKKARVLYGEFAYQNIIK